MKIPLHELQFEYSRSSGPGGQNINKVNSKATLRWNIMDCTILPKAVLERFLQKFKNKVLADGTVIVSSQRYRSQMQNMEDCLEKIQEMLDQATAVPKKRVPTKPSKGSIETRIKSKKAKANVKKMRNKSSYED